MTARVLRYIGREIGSWVEMPRQYVPERITLTDCRFDCALRVLEFTEARRLGLDGREGETIEVTS